MIGGEPGVAMPKIDLSAVPVRVGAAYLPPFDDPFAKRLHKRIGDAPGLSAFGVNLTTLPLGKWSSQRHCHSREDEFVLVLEGELTLVENAGETLLRAADRAAFPEGNGNGHHLKNHATASAAYLDVGSSHPDDLKHCADIDTTRTDREGWFVYTDGTPYA